MVRKTKEDAELTRQKIIQAAREMFLLKGVSRTSLEQIATHAGVTRGAVYWHFKNKAELFYAMREQVFLPLIDRMDDALVAEQADGDALSRIQHFLETTIHILNDDIQTRQTYEVMMSKCEYVDEFSEVLQDILNNCHSLVGKLEHAYEQAHAHQLIAPHLSARDLANDTHLFFSGLLHMWVKDTEGTHFRKQAITLIHQHIQLRKRSR